MIIAMARDTSEYPDRVYMGDICSALTVHRSTVVTWDRNSWLPEGLEFHRDESNRRYWTRAQLKKARKWHDRPGKRSAPHRTNAA